MLIRYIRLIDEDGSFNKYLRWARSRLPITFLQQQKPLVAIVITSLVLLILTDLFAPSVRRDSTINPPELNYGVIVDCGSSGSRAHIFEWRTNQKFVDLLRDKTNGRPLTKNVEPGLSSLKDDPERVSSYMEPIMSFLTKAIPPERHLDTPIFFLATAGLRLLDDSTQKRILTIMTRDIRAKYNFPRVKCQVISGQYEGIYSWLSLNKKMVYNSSQPFKSFGMIEMGGASTQVTFELDPGVENSILKSLKTNDAITTFRNEQTTIKLGPNKSVKLFAATFLGLGVNSARDSAIDLMVRDYLNGLDDIRSVRTDLEKADLRLKDPCLPIGSSEVVLRPSEMLQSKHQSIGLVIKDQSKSFKIVLEGVGNFLNCLNLLDRVLQIVKDERLNCPLDKQTCPMTLLGSAFIPYSHFPFVGLSEMFFTTNEMIQSAGQFNRSKVMHETRRICGTQYNKLLEIYSGDKVSYQDRVLYECFKASWLLNILHESGFGMPESYTNFQTVDQIDGQEIDWTIGAIMTEVALKEIDEAKN